MDEELEEQAVEAMKRALAAYGSQRLILIEEALRLHRAAMADDPDEPPSEA